MEIEKSKNKAQKISCFLLHKKFLFKKKIVLKLNVKYIFEKEKYGKYMNKKFCKKL